MFYDKNLMNSEMLRNVWKLAHKLTTKNIEKGNLPNICNELDSWVASESVMASRRLSLRTSSNLIGGAAMLYKLGLDKLYDDIIKMDDDITNRRKRVRDKSSVSETRSSSSESTAVPDIMRRQATVNVADSSFSPVKRLRTEPAVEITQRITMSKSPSLHTDVASCNEEGNPEQNSDKNHLDSEHISTVSTNSSDINQEKPLEEHFSEEENPERESKDKGVQTSPILTSRHRQNRVINNRQGNIEGHEFDKNLPFGYILIHDSYGSRIPSKIIFTSINNDIKDILAPGSGIHELNP